MPANADLQVNSDHCLINKQNKFVVLTLSPCIGSGGGWGGVGGKPQCRKEHPGEQYVASCRDPDTSSGTRFSGGHSNR